MTKLKVNFIVNRNDSGAPQLNYGATVPSGQTISGDGGMNVTGIVTASSFVGNGSGLTNLSIATRGRAFAYKVVFGPENTFRT